VLVGGDYHGANPDVQNAQQTMIGSDGISAQDAGTTATARRVIVWSDESTKFFGSISARGGSAKRQRRVSVETSGKGCRHSAAWTRARRTGNGGEWLLDPLDITILANGPDPLTCLPESVQSCLTICRASRPRFRSAR